MRIEQLEQAQSLIQSIYQNSKREINLMEFCGGHTVAILKNGINQLLPPGVHLLSGPGCPVCATSAADIDKIIQLSKQPDTITATFGDLIRVPGSQYSLQQSRASGNDIRTVYSALEALDIARQYPTRTVVMVGIGFETTAPTVAASILQAQREHIGNYLVLPVHKLTPPVMKTILQSRNTRLDGIICPGHVCTLIGSKPFEFIPRDYQISGAITGFEPVDILLGIDMLVKQIESGHPGLEIAYKQAVRPGGNQQAMNILHQVFDLTDAQWRGIGTIPESGLSLNQQFQSFDASKMFDLSFSESRETSECICGDILRAVKSPYDCSLFGKTCNPETPVGPCMVSAEGACSAFYLYGDRDG